jgi:N-dimethylarginine dimethylaminohydrolase
VDKGKIYVAETSRTNKEGVQFVQKTFADEFKVIPVQINSEENILHLDCIFNPVGNGYALIYEPAFAEVPPEIQTEYELIPVTRTEQQLLTTNVLSLSRNKIISRKHKHTERVHAVLKEKGIEVLEIPFDAVNSTGGSLRCASLPLVRMG